MPVNIMKNSDINLYVLKRCSQYKLCEIHLSFNNLKLLSLDLLFFKKKSWDGFLIKTVISDLWKKVQSIAAGENICFHANISLVQDVAPN